MSEQGVCENIKNKVSNTRAHILMNPHRERERERANEHAMCQIRFLSSFVLYIAGVYEPKITSFHDLSALCAEMSMSKRHSKNKWPCNRSKDKNRLYI